MIIAVAGGTGMVGRRVVEAARARGHQTVVLARSAGVDILSGAGLDAALEGADAVIDAASVQTRAADVSREFFGGSTRTLLAAEARLGVAHHIVLSIVGITPHDYYAGKVLQEQLVEAGDVPFTIQRATQFHEFAQQIHGTATLGPFVGAPMMLSQPVAAREVGERLVALAEAGPAGRVADLGGPEVLRMSHMLRAYGRAIGDRRPVIAVPLPGPGGRAMRDGSLLAGPDAVLGTQTFAQWLDEVAPRR